MVQVIKSQDVAYIPAFPLRNTNLEIKDCVFNYALVIV